jgi:hypothetical protein
VKLVRVLPFAAVATIIALVACDGVPDVTFANGDAATTDATVGGDGTTANADGSNGGSDGSGGADGSMGGGDGGGGTDAGKDAGKGAVDASFDGSDSGEVCVPNATTCCANHECVRCNTGHCNTCAMDCTDPLKPTCCYDSQGNGTLTCVGVGQTCP